ncbi:MAG: DUF1848 family protein [Desulfobacterales bacterium]
MNSPPKIVISASRRTDIPAFYMPWFMDRIKSGSFEVVNPFNQQARKVPATSDDVHTIVFWSKNFHLFLKENYGKKLQKAGYNLFFNFTINSESSRLEPHVPPLDVRMDQLKQLCDQFGSRAVNWRFDPICFFKTRDDIVQDNLGDLDRIAEKAAEFGIKRCITSFMDPYPKIEKRLAALPGFSFLDPPLKTKRQIIIQIEKTLSAVKINLKLCCEKEVLDALPTGTSITESACIPNDLLVALFGGKLSLKKDTGQRIQKGCGCKVSVDVGAYHLHPCYHNCLFCYANPASR